MDNFNEIKSDASRILVVDDDPFLRDLLARYLTRKRYDVRTAESGAAALNEMADASFQVAVIDILLGETTGIELVDELMRIDPEMIVILMTGHPSLETALEALKKGVQDYLIKPFKLEQLDDVLNKCLKEKKILAENQKLKAELEEARNQLGQYESLIRQTHLAIPHSSGEKPSGYSRGDAAYRFQSRRSKETALQNRLHKLSLLRDEGVITETEYEVWRDQLISMGGKEFHDDPSQ